MLTLKQFLRAVPRLNWQIKAADEKCCWTISSRCYSAKADEAQGGNGQGGSALQGQYNTKTDDSNGNPEKQFEFPKLYLDREYLGIRSGRIQEVVKRRALMQWLEKAESGENWSQQWGGPGPFQPYKIPLDVRMGAPQNMVPQPNKHGNLEFAKVQNFFHLTPPVIKKHCQRLKEFCTEWPKELQSDEDCEREFPVEIYTKDYVHAGQSQRHPTARVTTLRVRLCNLVLHNYARFKLIKLAKGRRGRYHPRTDMLTIKSGRCPIRRQNREYLDYLLTVLYYEAWKKEKWETREYMEDQDGIYWWRDSNSYNNLIRILKSHDSYKSILGDDSSKDKDDVIEEFGEVKEYRTAVENLKMPNQNATREEKLGAMLKYKESVRNLLKFPELT